MCHIMYVEVEDSHASYRVCGGQRSDMCHMCVVRGQPRMLASPPTSLGQSYELNAGCPGSSQEFSHL